MQRNKTSDSQLVSDEDLEKMAEYFWNAINTPRGLIQKVWFDLMLHLGADGIENQHTMRKESFILLKSQTDGRRRLQWKWNGMIRGCPIFDDPPNPLCPVKTFQLYMCKLNLSCPHIFQRPHEGATKTSRFWYHMFPLNSTMLALMMYDISKEARLSRVYPNFCTQILPSKEKFYHIFRTTWTKIDKFLIAPFERDDKDQPIAPFKLCQQCLVAVKSNKNDKNNDSYNFTQADDCSKGILCSVACYEAFMQAKEMRQQQQPGLQPTTVAGSSRLQMMPSILRNNRVTPINALAPPPILGKNLPPEVYKFIQQVARIQACGYPRADGVPLLFKEDYTPVVADIPKELFDLTVAVLNQSGQNRAPQSATTLTPTNIGVPAGTSLPLPLPLPHPQISQSTSHQAPNIPSMPNILRRN